MTALTEMFAVPYEDKDGNYLYWYDTPEFYEVISFIITKPSGFIEMVKWVKEKYNLSNANPTVAKPIDNISI